MFERKDGAEYDSINYMIVPIIEIREIPENMSAAGVRNTSAFLENVYNGSGVIAFVAFYNTMVLLINSKI